MNISYRKEGSLALRALITQFLGGKLLAPEFAARFESAYNQAVDMTTVDPADYQALSQLFDVVVWFSPSVEERSEVPQYVDEATVIGAVKTAARQLGLLA